VTIAVGGDVHFTGRTRRLLEDPATAFGPVRGVLAAADLSVVNLETAVTDGGVPEPKQFTFRAPPAAFDALTGAGVDVAVMANNHALDYGRTGLADTLRAARARNVAVVGVGVNERAAYAPVVRDIRGTRVAVLGLSQIHELADRWAARGDRSGVASALDVDRATRAVRAARSVADVVVVYLHWGMEGNHCPTPAMRRLARALAQAGADAIVSTHAHLLLGDGWLGRTYVAYGLGNFLWWRDNAYSNDTGVLTLTIRDRAVRGAVLTPARITATGQPVVATGAPAARIRAKFARLRGCTGLADAPTG